MTDLAAAYRPRRLQDVIAQSDAVEWLKHQAISGERRSVLISGPFGTGKTSLGRIYGQALICEMPEHGDPCLRCGSCKAFDAGEHSDFFAYQCGEQSTVEEIKDLLEIARTAPLIANRRVLLLDECHNLSRRAFEALLNIVEEPPDWTTFIFLTLKVESIPPALASRLPRKETTLLDPKQGVMFLTQVCAAEKLQFTERGLLLIHRAANGHPRSMLRKLEEVRFSGPVNEVNSRAVLGLDNTDRLVGILEALLMNNFPQLVAILNDWRETANTKLETVHACLTYLYMTEILHLAQDDAIFDTLPVDVVAAFCEQMRGRAQARALSVADFWESLIDTVNPTGRINDSQLMMVSKRLHGLVAQKYDAPERAIAPLVGNANDVRRRARSRAAGVTASASWKDIKVLWNAASFMMQNYGCVFNARLSVQWPEDLVLSQANILSSLTHQLRMRLSSWQGKGAHLDFHWIYKNETSAEGASFTRLALTLPEQSLAPATRWIKSFIRKHATDLAPINFQLRICFKPSTKFHWQCVRGMSRTIDPSAVILSNDNKVRPLVDLLGIPERLRQPSYPLRPAIQSFGMSETLGPKAQRTAATRQMEFLSAINDGAWHFLDHGWELSEFKDRQSELSRRRRTLAEIQAIYSADNKLAVNRQREELDRAIAKFPSRASDRLRRWRGWWISTEK